MENATTQSKEGLLEPVLPGSVTFDENILAPLQDNYLYKESKECFTYNSAYLINNAALQKRYAAFRAEKKKKGYSEHELEESFGFLLFDDLNKARKVGETGLLVGQTKCTTLGDSSKGVYISKYSDCLDLKRWYSGKTGYIILVKLTKGRVKEVTDNYTQNFTPPTPGFDCHVSEHLSAVTSTTSLFLAYERTQYYMYERIAGSSNTESCPRLACPLAIVAFSYGATAATSGLEEQSQDKKVFQYKPWIGQMMIESAVYDVGLQSVSGAWLPTKLPKMIKINRAMGVSELKRTLPREIFETCIVGEVCIDGKCYNLYDVVSSKAKNDLAQIIKELKEKDMAFVIPLDDSGFLILLHSSHLFSYEDAQSGKAAALQGMFIFPDSRSVPKDTKVALSKHTVSADIIQAIPALNYAETEMEKCPPNQQGAPHTTLEKHLQNYATLIQPGLLDAPTREASLFPDQYDVPSGFTLIAPKWSQETGTLLKSYFDEPCGFTVPVVRALELLAAGRQQRGDEQDDDIYYISSPEEVPQASRTNVAVNETEQEEAISDGHSTSGMAVENLKDKHKPLSIEKSQPALREELGTLGTAVVTVANKVPEYPISTVSPKLGDVATENCVSVDTDAKKSQECNEKVVGLSSKETPVQTSSTQLTISMEEGGTALSKGLGESIHPEKIMSKPDNKEDWRSLPKRRGRNRKMHWKATKETPVQTSSTQLTISKEEGGSEASKVPGESIHPEKVIAKPDTEGDWRSLPKRRGRNRKMHWKVSKETPVQTSSTQLTISKEEGGSEASKVLGESILPEKAMSNPDNKVDWRSLPKRKGRSRKMHWKTLQAIKEAQKELVLPISGLPLILPGNTTETQMDPKNDKTESDSQTANHNNPNSSRRGRGHWRKGIRRNMTETRKEHAPLKGTEVSTSAPVETIHDQGKTPDSVSTAKKDWRSLPRRKRLWNTDASLKRRLRSGALTTSNNDSLSDESSIYTTERTLSRVSRRKMEGVSLKDRYGLKSAFTKCGRVFVPHGSDAANGDSSDKGEFESTNEKMCVEMNIDTKSEIISPVENKFTEIVESSGELSSKEPADIPSKDNPRVQLETTQGEHDKTSPSETDKCQQSMTSTSNEAECLQNTSKDDSIANQADEPTSPPRGPDQSMSTFPKADSPEKTKKKSKRPVYSAISISKLKTVLIRGMQSMSSSPGGDKVSEPKSKKLKCESIMDDISNKQLKDEGYQSVSDVPQQTSLSDGGKPMKTLSKTKESVSWGSKPSKENGSLNFHTSAACEIVKQVNEHILPSPFGDGVGRISSDGKGSAEKFHMGATLPSDALSILADLALGASNKTITDLGVKPGKEMTAGVKGSGSPQSVLHALLRCPSTKIKLPPRSPFPEGLLVTGEFVLEISKEHSYSQPTSPLSGLSGTLPQSCSRFGYVQSPLALKSGLHLNLPVDAKSLCQNDGGKTEWKSLISPNKTLPSNVKTKTRKSRNFQNRHVIENNESIQVVRVWRDAYEFKYDSKFTNDDLDKAVMRALHGKWNFDIEDTYEEVHQIFHMWIGLFYSRTTSRLFHLENSPAFPGGKDIKDVSVTQDADTIQTGMPSLNVEFNLKENLPKTLHPNSEILDLSVKNGEPVNLHLYSKQSRRHVAVSYPGVVSHERAPKHSPSGRSLSYSPKVKELMNHRSAVDIPVENVVSDSEDDDENDIITDCSYTQILEGNSAYDAGGSPVSGKKEGIAETKDIIEVPDEDSRDEVLTVVEDGSLEEKTTSKSPSRDQSSVAGIKPSLDLNNHTIECDAHVGGLKDKVSPENSVKEQKETNNELEPLVEHEYHTNVADSSSLFVDGNNTKEPVEEKDKGSTLGETMQEDQSKSEERTNLHGSDSECKMPKAEDKSVMDVNDDPNSVDMEFSEEDSDDNAVIDVYALNIPSVKTLDSEPLNCVSINEDHDDKMEANDTRNEKPVVLHEGEKLGDNVCDETDSISSSGDVTVIEPMSGKETTLTSDNDSFAEMQTGSDNVTLEQKIVAQEAALGMCENETKPTHITESSNLEMSHSDKDKERCQQDTTIDDIVAVNENVHEKDTQSQTSYSCEDNTQVIDAHQKSQSPKICTSSLNSTTKNSDEKLATQALNQASEGEINSTCSTPTRDEVSYDSETSECSKKVLDFRERLNRVLRHTDNTDHNITELSPKTSLSPRSHVPFSNLTEHGDETHSEEPELIQSKYTDTMDFTVKDKSTCSPNENPEIQFELKLCPTSQQNDEQVNITESVSQKDSERSYRDYNVDEMHGYYHKSPSDEHSAWPDCKTNEPDSQQFDDDYHFDEDYYDTSYQVYNTSEDVDGSYEPEMEEIGDLCWEKKNYQSESPSTLDVANRRGDSFKYQTKVTYTPHYATSIDNMEFEQTSAKRRRKEKFTDVFYQNAEWDKEDSLSCTVDYSTGKTSYFETYQPKPTRTVTVNSLSQGRRHKQQFDWRKYFRREAVSRQLYDSDNERNTRFDIPPSSIVSILDKKGSRVIFENSPTTKPCVDTNKIPTRSQDSSHHWQDQQSEADVTQSLVDLEYLIFSEKLNSILKESRSSFHFSSRTVSNTERASFPVTVRFSDPNEQESSIELSRVRPSFPQFKIKVDLSDRKEKRARARKRRHGCESGSEASCSTISETTERSAASHRSSIRKNISPQTEAVKRKWEQDSDSQQSGFCVKQDVFEDLNFIVKQECSNKYRFYILVTSADAFFEDTRNLLMKNGHIPVEPHEFDLGDNNQSPLLIILRNEDIAEHISEVPYLLELKKSSNVLFAGIDRPDDVVNFTHQELFANGGFIVCDELAFDTLTLDNMKKVVGILDELEKKGKWKWFLHYKDSRKLRESARSSREASKKQSFIDWCQEAGIVEILPYHDCDVISRGRPDYLYCLTRLQMQNSSVRFPVFITDTPTDVFERNGILTMNIFTFSRILSKDSCSVS
ncbi:uncharacterized protein tasor2 isoform X2 [Misgurnus anguillicaudatus]|uniref:uncharacterized protein tasor2 isoform X2 n=1 Tax=Misgurnus anguillicaudatus TaxID=75329 RepID=UPI003CCF54B2